MIYLTNDALDQAVYFELRNPVPRSMGNGRGSVYFGLLGNGIHEVEVTLKKIRGRLEVAFGASELFSFVEEDRLRRMLGEVMATQAVH